VDFDLAQFVVDYGAYVYPLIFVFTFLEGETLIIFAGVAGASGLSQLDASYSCSRGSAASPVTSSIIGSADVGVRAS